MLAVLQRPWLSRSAVAGLALQITIGGLFAYVIAANRLGLIHSPDGSDISPLYCWVAINLSAGAIVSAIGIYRNRWWAYFMEAALIAAVVLLLVFSPGEDHPARATHTVPDIWGMKWFLFMGQMFWIIKLINTLIKQGRQAHKEQIASPSVS